MSADVGGPSRPKVTDLQGKRFATLCARCALVGATLQRSTDDSGRDSYVVSRWALTREFLTLGEVEAWLQQRTQAGVA